MTSSWRSITEALVSAIMERYFLHLHALKIWPLMVDPTLPRWQRLMPSELPRIILL